MSGTRPLRRGWRLSADGLSAPQASPSFLPGAERLSSFSDLLGGAQQESLPFTAPALLPPEAARRASLSLTLPPSAASGDALRLRFPLLRGKGRVLVGGRECARFCDSPLSLAPEVPAGPGPLVLTLEFEDGRPAGIVGTPCLSRAENAWLEELRLVPGTDGITLTARAECVMPGNYELTVKTSGADACSRLSFSLTPGEPRTLRLVHPLRRYGAELLVVSLQLQRPETALLCDRHTLRCGAQAAPPSAFLPLSRKETLADPDALIAQLLRLGIPGVLVPSPVPEALLTALSRAGIRAAVSGAGEEERSRLARCPGVSFSQDGPPAFSAADAAWQLCGLSACPRGGQLSPREMLTEALGAADEQTARDLPALLARIRADGMRMGLYSGPVAPAGSLDSPVYGRILRHAAEVHVAAFPLFGAWWCSSRFSCRIASPGAPEGCRVLASLQAEDGHVLCERAFPSGTQALFEAALPASPCRLLLRLTLLYPDGALSEEEPLPVFAGLRAPLEALAPSGRLP